MAHKEEIKRGERFAFGENWRKFISLLDDERIKEAEKSIHLMLNTNTLEGKAVLDIGSGSGLFSLVSRRMGAGVFSFDYDHDSVLCTRELKKRYFDGDSKWVIEEASVLDSNFLDKLDKYDLVYSWGVLHHTGDMWKSFENVLPLVKENGLLFIAIYNHQGWVSTYWRIVKSLYNQNVFFRTFMILLHFPYLFIGRFIVRMTKGHLKLERGMSIWYDMLDWLGGYPFEAAKPEMVFDFFYKNDFNLERLRTCGGRHGCNEFVFRKK